MSARLRAAPADASFAERPFGGWTGGPCHDRGRAIKQGLIASLLGTGSGESKSSRLDYHEGTFQLCSVCLNKAENGSLQLRSGCCGEANEDHTGHLHAMGVDELPKVPILCEEDSLFGRRKARDLRVRHPGPHFADCHHLVSRITEHSYRGEVAALVS